MVVMVVIYRLKGHWQRIGYCPFTKPKPQMDESHWTPAAFHAKLQDICSAACWDPCRSAPMCSNGKKCSPKNLCPLVLQGSIGCTEKGLKMDDINDQGKSPSASP